MRFTVRAPGSSANLGPGFDALGLAVDLWNEIVIDTDGVAGSVVYEGRDADLLAESDRENLSLRAMRQLAEAHGRTLPGFSLTVRTAVPVARGLGSSAAALVAGLLAADHLLGLGLSKDEVYAHSWRMEGHGDNVGASLYGGAILAVPRIPYAVQLCDAIGFEQLGLTTVVYIPEITGATWAARAALPSHVPLPDAAQNIATTAGLVAGFLTRNRDLLAAGMHDLLHQPYRARLFPHLTPLIEAAVETGAIGAALSGAGPSILALADREHAGPVARALTVAAARAGVHGEAVILEPSVVGAHVASTSPGAHGPG